MSRLHILVTGAAGFIGQHVTGKLLNLGHTVTTWDSMEEQVHGKGWEKWPRTGDMSLPDIPFDVVVHLAAKVGVGQSMYEPVDYVACNSLDTAKLLHNLTRVKPGRLVVASSMSVYGEGPLQDDSWGKTEPAPVSERKPVDLRSIYALTKYDQEQLALIWGQANKVPTVALRFFNTYGPGQSLNNPYTGVLAIFASRLLNGQAPVIYEDGQQTRDFVHVDDVANAVVHAAVGRQSWQDVDAEVYASDDGDRVVPSGTYNVGTGIPRTIESVARLMAEKLGADLPPVITGTKRAGDIRHCYADITKLRATGWSPQVTFEDGLTSYVEWLKGQAKPEDNFNKAATELEAAGLVK